MHGKVLVHVGDVISLQSCSVSLCLIYLCEMEVISSGIMNTIERAVF